MIGSFLRSSKASSLRDKGDAARDRRDWKVASHFYRQYLRHEPKSAEIWVQYGHSLKESGELGAAGLAYETALSLEPRNFDTHLQAGHLHKLRGDAAAAVEFYKSAVKLNPIHPDAMRELRNLGVSKQELASIIDARIAELEGQVFEMKQLRDEISKLEVDMSVMPTD